MLIQTQSVVQYIPDISLCSNQPEYAGGVLRFSFGIPKLILFISKTDKNAIFVPFIRGRWKIVNVCISPLYRQQDLNL